MTVPLIYDSLTRELQPAQPVDGRVFRFYCCGPTVYGPAHIGNFRTFLVQDCLRRVLEAAGIPTKHVRNITDVDDKTIRQSQAADQPLTVFTRHWLDRFHADCAALNMLPPHVEPSAVDHIPLQVELIKRLLDKGHAYVAEDGSVYYRVQSFPAYGRLSRLPEREITTNKLCCAHDHDEYERESAADFSLWKAHKAEDGPNHWPSPWGAGRPGWHLECSAMSMKYLGDSFDLHGGGIDLVFPHHENEIAQSEAATGQPFARLWFHSAHLMVEGRKMSKSLGNLYTLDDVRARGFTPMDLRYALLAGHYRQPLNFTWDSLQAAQSALRRIGQTLSDLAKVAGETLMTATVPDNDWGTFAPVQAALAHNLNTPEALGKLFRAVHDIERRIHTGEIHATEAGCRHVHLRRALEVFGFDPATDLPAATVPADVQALAQQRWAAKQQRDFAQADALRTQLQTAGWIVRDARDSYELVPVE